MNILAILICLVLTTAALSSNFLSVAQTERSPF
jgi:hypothetical protein